MSWQKIETFTVEQLNDKRRAFLWVRYLIHPGFEHDGNVKDDFTPYWTRWHIVKAIYSGPSVYSASWSLSPQPQQLIASMEVSHWMPEIDGPVDGPSGDISLSEYIRNK